MNRKKLHKVTHIHKAVLLLGVITIFLISFFSFQHTFRRTSIQVSAPMPSPTPVASKFIEQQSDRIGWRRVANERTNLSISFPESWSIAGKKTYGSEQITLMSPNNFVIDMSLGLYGVGGYAPTLAPDKFVYEQITFMDRTFYLSISLEPLLQEGKRVTVAGIHESPQPLWPIRVDNVGTNGDHPDNPIHGGYIGIQMYHTDNYGKTLFKTVEEFRSEDYDLAKEILASTRYVK